MTTEGTMLGLFAPERRKRMVELARTEGRLDVAKVSTTFGVTTETVRRDLNHLEHDGLLSRVHGGAVPVDRLQQSVPGLSERTATMLPEKRAIAKAALEEVPSSGSVIVDAGSTTARLADVFPRDRELVVITNSIGFVDTLLDAPRLNVMLLGGTVNPRTRATTDAWALRALEGLSADVAFMATTGLSVVKGLATANASDAEVKRAMVAASRRIVVLCDSSKIGVDRLFLFAPLSSIDLLITDAGADPTQLKELRSAGVQVKVARTRQHDESQE